MFLSRVVSLVRVWWRYNQNIRELSRLGDRELADIGIHRSEIQAVAWQSARG